MKKFQNKTALVTGATSGIGKEICTELAENGANIVIHFNKNKKEAELLATRIKALNVEVYLIQEDFSQGDLDEVCGKFIKKITSEFDGKQFGDINQDNDDIFALIVLQNVGYTEDEIIISNTINFILSKQKDNGSWDESVDMTGAAIEALIFFKENTKVKNSVS